MSAPRKAANNATTAPKSNAPRSGRTITNTPMKPATVASPRRQRTFSPSRKMAVRIMKIGAVKLIAVESVSGNRAVA